MPLGDKPSATVLENYDCVRQRRRHHWRLLCYASDMCSGSLEHKEFGRYFCFLFCFSQSKVLRIIGRSRGEPVELNSDEYTGDCNT